MMVIVTFHKHYSNFLLQLFYTQTYRFMYNQETILKSLLTDIPIFKQIQREDFPNINDTHFKNQYQMC